MIVWHTQKTKLFLAWILANAIGGFLVGFLENNGAQFMATLLLSGAILGTSQWLIFRWLNAKGLRWTLWPVASALGWIISTMIGILVSPIIPGVLSSAATSTGEIFWLNFINQPMYIICMAIAQGMILSYHARYRLRTIGVWLLASCLGAALHGAVSALICHSVCQTLPSTLIGIVESKGWAVYGIITGFALLWVLPTSAVGGKSPLAQPD
ncbi:hypothetical protein N836_04820 [Leptolyngbya sp. Heron Island J]|uniref:hypothetical protein n=1 Tax=Leptolyngbya sp. Heron Island J TaxID=1385935 RepID=UPI0003B951D8|nr:hypothetical protein [Leptolyngbya sp. Heron Island J]ESA36885.1 hypothetical protein N836_04820 [Leptolyngbya sp. Heron Island J]